MSIDYGINVNILAVIILCLFSVSDNEMREVPEKICSVQFVTELEGLVKRGDRSSFFTEGEAGAQPRRTCGAHLYSGITARGLGRKPGGPFHWAAGTLASETK